MKLRDSIEKDYWICLQDSRSCDEVGGAINLLGSADCEMCRNYKNCGICGRLNSSFCSTCLRRKGEKKNET